MDEINNWIKQAKKELTNEYGLLASFAGDIALLYLYFYYYNLSPVITSGYRSMQKQQELLDRYNAGDPTIRYKPALDSKHSAAEGFFKKPASKAVDISTSNPALAADIAEALNIGAGYRYGDPVHYYHKSI
jgi:hypothetical protein